VGFTPQQARQHSLQWVPTPRSGPNLRFEGALLSRPISQRPGKFYTFVRKKTKEKDSGILPNKYGVSNEFAEWVKNPKCKNGGHWQSHLFHSRRRKELGENMERGGLLSRMRRIINDSKHLARRRNHKPITTTPEEMIRQWFNQEFKCVMCGQPLTLLAAHYDHDHENGVGRGFAHGMCNILEGKLKSVPDEYLIRYIRHLRPHLKITTTMVETTSRALPDSAF
jgi:hypothetical protein